MNHAIMVFLLKLFKKISILSVFIAETIPFYFETNTFTQVPSLHKKFNALTQLPFLNSPQKLTKSNANLK